MLGDEVASKLKIPEKARSTTLQHNSWASSREEPGTLSQSGQVPQSRGHGGDFRPVHRRRVRSCAKGLQPILGPDLKMERCARRVPGPQSKPDSSFSPNHKYSNTLSALSFRVSLQGRNQCLDFINPALNLSRVLFGFFSNPRSSKGG